jgi:hypothetical protein
MTSIFFEMARVEDGKALCGLMKGSAMDGAIRISMEREPDYFLGIQVQSSQAVVIVARESATGKPVGVCSLGRRDVFVNGNTAAIPYLGDLRIHPEHRNGFILGRGYHYLREFLPPEDYAQSVILSENFPARQLLTSGRAGLPHYFPYGQCASTAVYLRTRKGGRKGPGALAVRKAEAKDLPGMQDFLDREGPSKQFYPAYRFERDFGSPYFHGLEPGNFYLAFDGTTLVGCASVWDQNSFKQTRIAGYSRLLAALRPLLNGWSALLGAPLLPPSGTCLNYFHLHSVLTKDNDPGIFAKLVEAVRGDYAGGAYDYFVCGMDVRDPLLDVLQACPHRSFTGLQYLVSFGYDPRPSLQPGPFFLESGRM